MNTPRMTPDMNESSRRIWREVVPGKGPPTATIVTDVTGHGWRVDMSASATVADALGAVGAKHPVRHVVGSNVSDGPHAYKQTRTLVPDMNVPIAWKVITATFEATDAAPFKVTVLEVGEDTQLVHRDVTRGDGETVWGGVSAAHPNFAATAADDISRARL